MLILGITMEFRPLTILNWWRYFKHTGSWKGINVLYSMLTLSLLTQLFVVIMLRTQHIPLIQSRPAKPMAAALVLIAAVGMSLPYIPGINSALKMQHPRPTFYGFLAAILTTYILLVQLVKVIYKRIYKQWI